jgi:hypothetical protein
MATPPPRNTEYIKIDDGSFYIASTSSQQVDVDSYIGQLHALCVSALSIGATLRAAAAAGVGKAADVVAVFNTVEAFSNEEKATAFLGALRAIKDA